MSFLDSFISKALDAALLGPQGSPGGGLFGSLLSGLFGGASIPVQNAFGNAFLGGQVTAFASGGVVSGATLFPMRGGLGQMGEAGPEAIMPLQRTSSGHLGVRASGGGGSSVNVVVNNNAGAEVSTRSRQNSSGGIDLEIILERKMGEYLGRDDVVQAQAQRLGTRPPAQAWG